jgi:hypothetical protein
MPLKRIDLWSLVVAVEIKERTCLVYPTFKGSESPSRFSLNLSQFVEDQNGLNTSQILLPWPYWQW